MGNAVCGSETSSPLTPETIIFIKKNTHASGELIDELCNIFLLKYPDGKIRQNDLNNMMKTCFPGLYVDDLDAHIFRMFDINQDGVIDAYEFLIAVTILGSGSVEDKLEQIFRIYDVNNDGLISKEELTRTAKILSNWNDKTTTVKENHGTNETPRKVSQEWLAQRVFMAIDKDGDAKLTKDEFINGCKSNEWINSILIQTINDMLKLYKLA